MAKPLSDFEWRARALVCLASLLVLGYFAGAAMAQNYPARPIRMIVGFPPGGGTDVMARIVGQKLSDALGQQVIVENRPGAGGNIAAELTAKAPADGYTLMMGHVAPMAIAPSLYPKLAYDPARDFAPISFVASSPNILVVNPSVPVKDVRTLIALAKTQPGRLKFASSGAGTIQHLAAESFQQAAGAEMLHVPYKGSGQAVIDLMAGVVDMNFDATPSVINFVKQGKLRALAVTSAKRSALVPDLPTLAESGLTGFDFNTWWGLFAPAGTPRDVVKRLNVEVVKLLALPDVKEKLANVGAEPAGDTPEEFSAFIRTEIVKWGKVIREGHITLQ